MTIASLYFGTGGGREGEFVAALAAAAHDVQARPHLRLRVLLDALRSTRPTKGATTAPGAGTSEAAGGGNATEGPAMTSTAELLAVQLLEGQAQEGRVGVSLFHTPALRGVLKRCALETGLRRLAGCLRGWPALQPRPLCRAAGCCRRGSARWWACST